MSARHATSAFRHAVTRTTLSSSPDSKRDRCHDGFVRSADRHRTDYSLHTPDRAVRRRRCASDPWRAPPSIRSNLTFRERQMEFSVRTSQERQARPLVVGCSTETGSDAGKVFLRASSRASSWRVRLSLSPSSRWGLRFGSAIISVSPAALIKIFGGYDANFGALIVERYAFRVVRLPQNVLMATRPSAVLPLLERIGS
jgi:hypothetical protein